jgi:hypothetical protein
LYRYRIAVYDLLNRPAGISDWIPFRVFPALQPELYSFSQEFVSSGEADPQGGIEIVLYGLNLIEGSEIQFLPADTGGNPLAPLAYLPSGKRARLIFSRETVAPGRYRVYVRNPGGLETSLEITVNPPPLPADSGSDDSSAAPAPADSPPVPPAGDSGPRWPFAIYLSAEYAPLIPLSGYIFNPFNQKFYPGGATLRIGIVPIMQSWGDLGLELAPSWNMLESGTIKVHMETLHLNGVYQRWFFNQTMAFILRLGAGVHLVHGTNSSDQSFGSIFTWIVSAEGGIFFRWFLPAIHGFRRTVRRTFYLETGVEYTHLFAKDSPVDYVKPVLGAGWRF